MLLACDYAGIAAPKSVAALGFRAQGSDRKRNRPGRGSNRVCGLLPRWLIYTGQRIVVTVTVLVASVVLLASRLLFIANHVVRIDLWCVKSCAGIVVVGSQYFPSLTRYP
jgi:hypothetical protein